MIEKNIKRLEEISNILEKGANLDDSLKLYEEGCKLAKLCLKELEKAKGKIIMVKNEFQSKDEQNGEE